MQSILCNEARCYRCGSIYNLHRHHIFYGTYRRKKSEEYGCWVYLCGKHHNMSSFGVHFDRAFDNELKRECQLKWEELNGSREDFIKEFGKSYV